MTLLKWESRAAVHPYLALPANSTLLCLTAVYFNLTRYTRVFKSSVATSGWRHELTVAPGEWQSVVGEAGNLHSSGNKYRIVNVRHGSIPHITVSCIMAAM